MKISSEYFENYCKSISKKASNKLFIYELQTYTKIII